MAVVPDFQAKLSLPLIAAPMSGVSSPELVTEACLSGIVGAFPTRNCRTLEELDLWLTNIQTARHRAEAEGKPSGLLSANLVIRGNNRLPEDIQAIIRHGVDFVITSVGSPKEFVSPLHDAGISVFADVASMHHAHRALEAGVDGLVLLSAGAGGHTGWANGFAFTRAVRAEYDGPVVMAGGISDGTALWAAIVLGCDLAYMGTKFIATHESAASDDYRRKLTEISFDEIELGIAPNGVAASTIRGGAGSAGHSVSGVTRIMSVRDVVAETRAEWNAARAATAAALNAPKVSAPA
ncbi:MAG: NAD(P)H-dependent flavin oxidoreductase [Dehalococcoidia bacterium]